ncbi:MAG: methyltransferase domain-containing protein [Lyngbya sp. HA4199-MV5]|jgi:SAM-dependent methyltransferase|nr:methyltransferase domain-containing protein [Lyngbya sp. HA4199-MV5]
MKDLKQTLRNECYSKDLEQRKHWYSPIAAAYQQVRPRYPQVIIDRVVDIARLSADSTVLEVGCGPAIATPAFAALGWSMVCVEPNPDFYRLAQQTCEPYPNVELRNCLFEEWELEPGKFDAVLAASSFHWIAPEVGYPKAAAALRPEGALILLWNKELQPRYEVYQQLSEVYQAHTPTLNRAYEDSTTQAEILDQLGQVAIESGYFKDRVSGQTKVEVTYSVDQYLLLLNTYSPHLQLEPQQKQPLIEGLRQVLEQNGDTVQLSYVSAFHIVRPK